MNPEAHLIARLGREHSDTRGALDAIGRGLTAEQYRSDLAQRVRRAKLVDVDLGATPYSIADALRDTIEGRRSLATEQSDEIFRQTGTPRQHAHAVAVPPEMLFGTRAAASTLTTGAELLQQPAAFMGALGSSLN